MMTFRMAEAEDVDLFYEWANDEDARRNSYSRSPISYEDHVRWFNGRLQSPNCTFYIFIDEGAPVGQVRIEHTAGADGEAIMSISVDKKSRGKGYGSKMIAMASDEYLNSRPGDYVLAYIFKTNQPSYRAFKKAGFNDYREEEVKGVPSYILKKQ